MQVGIIAQIEGELVKIQVMGEGLERDLFFTYMVGGKGDILFSLNGEYYAMADMRKQGELITYEPGQQDQKQFVCWILLRSVSAMQPVPELPRIAQIEDILYDVVERDAPDNDPGIRAVCLNIKSEPLAQYLYRLGKLNS